MGADRRTTGRLSLVWLIAAILVVEVLGLSLSTWSDGGWQWGDLVPAVALPIVVTWVWRRSRN
ncbi:hypothetical protein CLV35_3063 [Motilibacter peucedani]|uniref:Uncharacterized protein n=1 Tax=Motilibacter peucedani TaxID=598650 RepID=A0A420XNG3_9ACTN|nr:hypothetical protein [Motilibacter peucedani]RKS72812.1 hypothetical protein CLV35_3063 [Motilibacter peucedani]